MQISMFSSKGNVIVIGDFNARTSDKDDFITNDVIQNDILREVSEILTYETDTVLPTRVNPDKTVNEYGRKLLSLCKSSGLRILNGRHNHGLDRAYSFIGARGLSVVDYCISTPNVFHLIEKFIISNFTTFSDHAPLHLQFKTKTSECKQSLNPCGDSVNNARPARTFRWNPEYEYEAKLELRKSLESLMCFSKSQMKNLKTKKMHPLMDLLHFFRK